MNQYVLQQGSSKELQPFSRIAEFALKKNNSIQLNSLYATATDNLRIYYIVEGKFEWIINDQHHVLFPGDLAFILPGQTFCGEENVLNVGSLYWLHVQIEHLAPGEMLLSKWSGLSEHEGLTVAKMLLVQNSPVLLEMKEAAAILHNIEHELFHEEIGYCTRVNQLVDELFILIARQSTRQINLRHDFPQTFMKLEQSLRQNLSHQWTVDEMAALIGFGTTAFTEKVKRYTGFSPQNYLINLRISEAIRMLKGHNVNVTDIALDTGFYSSQHFSTTFKKLTGYTPGEFRKRKAEQDL